MKIVADDKIPYLKGVLEPFADVVYLPGGKISPADVADADALIVRTRTVCDKKLLGQSKVKLVATATIGFDHINTAELDETGIIWRNAPGCNALSVKHYIASALAALDRDLTGSTLGIIGVGHVGKNIADIGRAFGMNVLLNDPPRAEAEGDAAFTALSELLPVSDIVTLHVPLERGGKYPTLNMADETFFTMMKPGAYFFNSCRGEVMDKAAFIAASVQGKLSGALIDVWPDEPELDPAMMTHVDFGTPHIAGYSREGKANGTGAAVRAVAEFFDIPQLKDFNVTALPAPEYPAVITVDNTLPAWKQIASAVLHTYDIRRDSDALRNAPGEFERLRGSYWNRREFSAYTVLNAAGEVASALQLLGFNIG